MSLFLRSTLVESSGEVDTTAPESPYYALLNSRPSLVKRLEFMVIIGIRVWQTICAPQLVSARGIWSKNKPDVTGIVFLSGVISSVSGRPLCGCRKGRPSWPTRRLCHFTRSSAVNGWHYPDLPGNSVRNLSCWQGRTA